MASTPAFHRNEEEAKLLEQNEGPIASRLRSRFKTGDVNTHHTGGIDVNNQTGKPSQLSRHQTDKSNNNPLSEKSEEVQTGSTGQPSLDKCTKKSNDSKPKSFEVHGSSSSCIATCLSLKNEGAMNSENSSETGRVQGLQNQHAKSKASDDQPPQSKTESKNQEPSKIESSVTNMSNTGGPSSYDVEKEEEKTRPSQKQAKQSINEHPKYYIRWKGPEKTSKCWNCALCEKDMACLTNEEESMHSSHEENELQYTLFSHVGEEMGSLVPEAAVLPCSHVFHSICLSNALQLTNHTDPPCPICLSMLET